MGKFRSFASVLAGESLIDSQTRAAIDQVYKQFDTNRDGGLSRSEIKKAAASTNQPMTDAELNQAFQMIDTNRDGLISKAELIKFIDAFQNKNLNLIQTKSEQTDNIFKAYDANKDGYLNDKEVLKMLRDILGYANERDAKTFIRELDTDFDGKLSKSEVQAALK